MISPDCDGLRSRLIAMDCDHLSPSDRPIWQVLLKVIKPYTRISIGFIAVSYTHLTLPTIYSV